MSVTLNVEHPVQEEAQSKEKCSSAHLRMGSGLITELVLRSLCFSLQFLLSEKAAEVTNGNSDGIKFYWRKVASHNVSRSQLETLEDRPIPVELLPYLEQGKRTYESFKQILQNTTWEPMTTLSDDVIKVASAHNRESGLTMIHFETVVNVSVDVIFRDVWDHMQDCPKWNHNLQRVEVVLDITPRCRLLYDVLHPIGNGIIWSRDIVAIMYWDKEGDGIHVAFASTSWPALLPSSQYVRATIYPQGYAYIPMPGDPEQTLIRWVNHMDAHLAFIPAPVINLFIAKIGRDTLISFRDHLETLRKEFTELKGV
ncbi:unnamed protein product [Darwinula stevensoni]|uniref:START domain-containing protein n=1 Tax=Darwinula stevensoni TaxID=69355 RepID=A0A7R8X9J8_9CRUS|nr:unnamed protein product [Darwinula stevensoni]CAG0889069.1 unnamed protein product [Darwinula stevensoni]